MMVILVTINSQIKITDIDVKKQPKKFLSCTVQIQCMLHLLTCANQMLPGLVQKLFIERLLSWTDHVINEEVLLRVNEQRNILHEVRKRKANWIGHILRRNCLLKQVIEGKIKGEME